MSQRSIAVGSLAPEIRLSRGIEQAKCSGEVGARARRAAYVTVVVEENGGLREVGPTTSASSVVTLTERRDRGHVVIYFMRDFQSLPCRAHVRRLAANADALAHYRATALIIGPGSVADAAKLAGDLNVSFPVLADPTEQTYRAYGLRKVMFNTILQSATVLVDQAGVVRYIRRATLPGGAFHDEALFLALRTMSSVK